MNAPPANRRSANGFAVGASAAAVLLAAASVVVVNLNYDEADGGGGSAGPVAVSLAEWSISPDPIVVPEGGTLAVTNAGTMEHNLEVTGQGLVTANLAGGASGSLDVSSLPAGTYEVFCNISGHKDQGMVASMQVGGSATDAAAGGGSHAEHDWAASDQSMIDTTNEYVQAVVESLATGTPSGVPTEGRGNQFLEGTIAADGYLELELSADIIEWEVEPGKVVEAWAYNGMVPSPWIKVDPGQNVRVTLTNNLPAGTDIHWHGITTPFAADGVAPITQKMVMPGETHVYEFTAPTTPELGMYHPHNHGQVAVVNGMFGVFQVGELDLPDGQTVNGVEVPTGLVPTEELAMVLNDAGTIGLSLNGKAFPATDPVISRPGDWHLIHYYNEGLTLHPMHLHHLPQLVVAKDGFPLTQPYWADTVNVAPGERYSVLVRTTENDLDLTDPANPGPGIWAYHCHILTHAESDRGLFGMVTAWVVLPNEETDGA